MLFAMRGDVSQKSVDEIPRRDPLGLGSKVGQDAVLEDSRSESDNVLLRDGEAAREKRPRLATQDEELRGPGTGPPGHLFVNECRCPLTPRSTRLHEADGLSDNVVRCRHAIHQRH